MGIKTGAAGGGLDFLGRDVGRSDTKLGQMVQRLGKAKSTGAGIGGLLGGIVGQILIPIPGVGAAIGAGLGSLFGSKVGGATSGVNQGDILNSKFRKDSAHNMTTQIANQEFANVAKSTVSSFMQGINPASSLSKFGKGFESGAGMNIPDLVANPDLSMGDKFMGGMKGGFGELFKKPPMPKMPELAPGNVTGDATSTDVPGLLGGVTNQSSYSFSPLHQPQSGNNPLMDEFFPDKSADEAAQSMGMDLEEFLPWLQSMGSK